MTDPRIEAAARAIAEYVYERAGKSLKWEDMGDTRQEVARGYASVGLAAADAAAGVRAVPFPIPDDRMETAKNTLLCWKSGAISDEDCVGIIVCGVAALPAPSNNEVQG